MSNEQIALIASVILTNSKDNYTDLTLNRAETFLQWLEEKKKEKLKWGNKNHETNEERAIFFNMSVFSTSSPNGNPG